MGQAKKRGSFEERRANPQGYPAPTPWTEEDKQKIVEACKGTVENTRKSLFGPVKKKKPKKRTRVRVKRK